MTNTPITVPAERKTLAQLLLERDGVAYVDESGRDLTFLTGYAREYGLLYREGRIAEKRAADAEREAWWAATKAAVPHRPLVTPGGVEKMIGDMNRVAADALFSDPATNRAVERL